MKLNGKAIKLRRIELNIRQKELAEKININANTLSLIENNKAMTSLKKIFKLCEILQVPIEYLFIEE